MDAAPSDSDHMDPGLQHPVNAGFEQVPSVPKCRAHGMTFNLTVLWHVPRKVSFRTASALPLLPKPDDIRLSVY